MTQTATPAYRPAFEIVLVNAGAVSGGAYTAGALDFLYEALDQWTRAKADAAAGNGPAVPDHDVILRGAAGASAGAIGNALTAIAPWHGIHPVRDLVRRDPDGTLSGVAAAEDAASWQVNEFFRSWVIEADRISLFGTSDLEREATVPSLLNADMVDAIGDGLIGRLTEAAPAPPQYPFIAADYRLTLCVTNLPGLPYRIAMGGLAGTDGQTVTTHGDYVAFRVSGLGAGAARSDPAPAASLPPPAPAMRDDWLPLTAAVAASAAVPVGFRARPVAQPADVYLQRPWTVPADPASGRHTDLRHIPPAWDPMPAEYAYWAIDGGIVDNAPVELGRQILAGAGSRNPRDARQAHRALLLIDPFPDAPPPYRPPGPMPGMLAVAGSLFGLWWQQTRFDPAELETAAAEPVRSRFMLAPVRVAAGGERFIGARALCAGGLGGFAGFLAQRYRLHDYQLGRRNMQKFLRDHFTLDPENAVFGGWPARQPEAAAAFFARDHDDRPERHEFPVIPLCGTAAGEVLPYPWPAGIPLAKDCVPLIRRRLDLMLPRLLAEAVSHADRHAGAAWLHRAIGWMLRPVLWLLGRWLSARLVKAIGRQIDAFQADWKL
ncbi:hypothetical protein [Ferrovibrio sp.]|uniref:hypothetical protein n=2 Tax=Ferrovibrio sp. TaxID=1917215 RepID=UPI0035181B57